MEQSQPLPIVDVSFAPTSAFQRTHDAKTVSEQTAKFTAPSWVGAITQNPPISEAEVEHVELDCEDRCRAGTLAVVLFAGGGVLAAFLLWRMGYLKFE